MKSFHLLVESTGETRLASEIKRSDVDVLINYLRTIRNCKDSTIDRYISALSKMYNLAIDDDILIKNPCAKIRKLAPYDGKHYKYWEDEEIDNMLQTMPNNFRDMIEVALLTSLRKSNIRLMQKEWINLIDNTLIVPREHIKSRKPLVFPLPINSKLREILVRNMNNNNNTKYVFVNTKRQKPYSDKTLDKILIKCCKNAGIPKYGYHGFRHTSGCRMANNNLPIQSIQEYMGHSTIKMTEKYLHNPKDSMTKAMMILEGCQK